LTKGDTGTLELTADNTGWTGPLTVAQGILRLSHNAAAGSGAISTTSAVGAGVQLNNVTIANALNYGITGGAVSSGVNFGGGLQALAGTTNTVTGLITQASGSALLLSADSGATLNLGGTYSISNTLYVGGAGSVNFTTAVPNTGIIKLGPGTATLAANSAAFTNSIVVQAGTFRIQGSGVAVGGTGALNVSNQATLAIDDSLGALSTHMGTRAVSLLGGNFVYTGNVNNSTETAGTLTLAQGGGSTITLNQTGAGTVALTFASLTFSADTSLLFSGANLGTATNRLLFTTAPALIPASTGILFRSIINTGSNFDFATYNATNGITAFTGYTNPADINTSASTDTVNITANQTITASVVRTVNALKITGTGITIAGAATTSATQPTTLALSATAIAVTGGSNTISVPALNFAGQQGVVSVDAGSTLTLTSRLNGTAGFIKAGPGTLNLNPGPNLIGVAGITVNHAFDNTFSVNGGTLTIGSTNAITTGEFLRVNTGTFNLGANSQFLRAFFSDSTNGGTAGNSVEGAGGIITGLAGSNLVTDHDNTNRPWAGSLQGALNFVRSGQNTQQFYSNNTYTGTTTIMGGTTQLRDGGRFSGTTAVEINFATLQLDNNLLTPPGPERWGIA
jgi:autotransporter-associated beta strand protein